MLCYGPIIDATSNANHGTKKSVNEPTEATGKVGQGQDFDGSDDYIYLGNDSSLNIQDEITVETLLNTPYLPSELPRSFARIIGTYNDYPMLYYYKTTGELQLKLGSSVDKIRCAVAENNLSKNNFMHLVATYSKTATTAKIYVDGIEKDSETTNNASIGHSYNWYINDNQPSPYPTDGIYDEARISSTNRSAAWIAATYDSLWDTLLTYGAEETGGSEPESSSNILFIFSNF